jgi:putative oxygen-independent coproporphyrinogen III oxidase
MSPTNIQPRPLAIYMHWPFCLAKCPYCDFNSHVRESVPQDRWRAAMLRELDTMAQRIGANWQVSSIFFGGGTPSLMPPETVDALISRTKELWKHTGNCEITLEANPTSSEADKFRGFRDAGVNRVSLGVQSLRPEALKFLGREHSAKEAVTAVKLAADIFPRYSLDLIYARPNQDPKDWLQELKQALTIIRGHISLYQLTMEQGTAFYPRYQRGEIILPPEDTAVELYEMTRDLCARHGLHAYEISNYAASGQESRHNLAYWQGDAYLGVGAGAHGRILDLDGQWVATSTLKSPERWLDQVESKGHGLEHEDIVPQTERAEELLLTGLRLKSGIVKAHFEASCGIALDGILDHDALRRLSQQGLVIDNPLCLKLSNEGRLLLDSVAAGLLA